MLALGRSISQSRKLEISRLNSARNCFKLNQTHSITVLLVIVAIVPLFATTPSRCVQAPFPVVTVRASGKSRMVQGIPSDSSSGKHLLAT